MTKDLYRRAIAFLAQKCAEEAGGCADDFILEALHNADLNIVGDGNCVLEIERKFIIGELTQVDGRIKACELVGLTDDIQQLQSERVSRLQQLDELESNRHERVWSC